MKPRSPAPDHSFTEYVLDQLSDLPGLEPRAMFGGHGLYVGGSFFALVYQGRLYFRVDDFSRQDFVARGAAPFKPGIARPMKSYYEVPVEVLEDRAELVHWAKRALRARPEH